MRKQPQSLRRSYWGSDGCVCGNTRAARCALPEGAQSCEPRPGRASSKDRATLLLHVCYVLLPKPKCAFLLGFEGACGGEMIPRISAKSIPVWP